VLDETEGELEEFAGSAHVPIVFMAVRRESRRR
jgi:hypothetical protein